MMDLPLDTTPPIVLTIAGSDSGGGAGIQADLKAIAANGCYGTSVITALTSQNTLGVQGVHAIPPAFVAKQIKSIFEDIPPDAMKTGMLYDADIIKAVVTTLKAHSQASDKKSPPLVCDPVCVSTSGHSLLNPQAIDVLIAELFPITTLITPNKAEAELLLSHQKMEPKEIMSIKDMISACSSLLKLGSTAVLLKGGHFSASLDDVNGLKEDPDLQVEVIMQHVFPENSEILQLHGDIKHPQTLVVDVLTESTESGESKTTAFVRPRLESNNTHGTGCTLSAAIASNLACSTSLRVAVQEAIEYTYLGIQLAYPIGSGHGPLNHFHSTTVRMIPRITKSNPYPFTQMLIQGNASEWRQYVEHDFVKLLGLGTLSKDSFINFIVQDYHYLKYYARAYALLAAKSSTFDAIGTATETILNILKEINTHRSLCAEFGVSREALESAPEVPATTAYGAYIMDVGLSGDRTRLLMAVLACLLGYGEVGLWLKKEAALPDSWVVMEGNPYRKWMDDYGGEHYQNAVKLGLEVIEATAQADPPSPARFQEWREVWERCTRLEKGFWDAALDSTYYVYYE